MARVLSDIISKKNKCCQIPPEESHAQEICEVSYLWPQAENDACEMETYSKLTLQPVFIALDNFEKA